MTDGQPAKQEAAAANTKTWRDFLENSPPESQELVTGSIKFSSTDHYKTTGPSLQLRCDQPECDATMWFDHKEGEGFMPLHQWEPFVSVYICRHCKKAFKTFAIYIRANSAAEATAIKVGEYPPFGPHTPSRLISLIGPDRDLFLKGRKSENRALGIGAFAYYRRVVENQKNRILEEIAKVAEKVGAKPEVVSSLKAAMTETQFSTAVDSIKAGIPESLLIDGHNPLKLLHSALSRGLHDEDDETCLKLAQSIRVVLTELAERIDLALKDHAELKSAVSRILQENARK